VVSAAAGIDRIARGREADGFAGRGERTADRAVVGVAATRGSDVIFGRAARQRRDERNNTASQNCQEVPPPPPQPFAPSPRKGATRRPAITATCTFSLFKEYRIDQSAEAKTPFLGSFCKQSDARLQPSVQDVRPAWHAPAVRASAAVRRH